MGRRLRGPRPIRTAEQLAITWQSASILLGYPDPTRSAHLDVVEQALARLEGPAAAELAAPLRRTLQHLRSTPLQQAQADYVATFDHRRRTNLFLTYFAHGDTRKRGVALLRFKQTYLRSGFVLDDTELPDHLCVVLEYAALVDQRLGARLLVDHRAGLELLRLGLAEEGSGWAGAVEAVCATLPPLQGEEVAAIRALAAQGPPVEEVGLNPYGSAAFDPALVDLPDPTMPAREVPVR